MSKLSSEYLKEVFYAKAKELGRTPTKREVKHNGAIANRFGKGSWNEAVKHLGYEPNEVVRFTKEQLEQILIDWAKNNGRYPMVEDFNNNPKLPDTTTYVKHFGISFSSIVEQVLNVKVQRRQEKRYSYKDLVETFKTEYERIKPNTKAEFNDKRNKAFPHTSAIRNIYKLNYNQLKQLAGIEDITNPRRTKKEWQDILRNIIEELGYVPSTIELEEKYGINRKSFYPYLGTYNKALKELGYEPRHDTPIEVVVTKEELFEKYLDLSKKLGYLATTNDLNSRDDIPSADVYANRFGSIGELKKEARKVLKFDEPVYLNKEYDKNDIKEMLLKAKKDYGRRLTKKEISENKDLPSVSTILRYFKTTSMREVWEEVDNIKEGN